MANAILERTNAKDFLTMAEQTTRLTTAKCSPFTKAPNLKLADTIHRMMRPSMQFTEMQQMSPLGTLQFLMIPLHEERLSGSAP